MGQEVKNPLRSQSKYGLMGSSAKAGKCCLRGSPEHFLNENAIWDRTPSHLHINCSLHVWGRVQGSQIFKRNSIISIRSKVMAFLVISLSLWSPHCPHVIAVVPMSSPCRPRHPHIVPIAPRKSPCGPHGCGLRGLRCLHGLHPMLSLWSPCRPRHPHIVPVSFSLSPHRLEGPHIIRNPPDTHSTHPLSPWEGGGPKSVKMQ